MADKLSPAAQAVRRDFFQIMHELHQRCRVSVSATDTLPITLETNDASLQAGINSLCAAALRAAASQLTSAKAIDQLLAIAAELDGTQPSSENV
jgi:hypothetical protein